MGKLKLITHQLNNLYVVETIGANNKRYVKKLAEKLGMVFVDLTKGQKLLPNVDEVDNALKDMILKLNGMNMANRYCFYGSPESTSILQMLYGDYFRAANSAALCDLNFMKGKIIFLESKPHIGMAGLRKMKRKDKSLKIFEKSDVELYNKVLGEFIGTGADDSAHIDVADKTDITTMSHIALTLLGRGNEIEI